MSLLKCLSPIRLLNTSKINMKNNYKKVVGASGNYASYDYSSNDDLNYMLVSCGKCKNCLQRKSNEKAARILDELEYYSFDTLDSIEKKEMSFKRKINYFHNVSFHYEYQVIFTTLTYNQSSISSNYSLCKDDVIKFKKRLRRRLETFYKQQLKELAITDRKYSEIYNDKLLKKQYINNKMCRIKFVDAGEYGENYHRPHYHLLIFGLSPILRNFKLIADCWKSGKSQSESIRSSDLATKYVLKITKYITKSACKTLKFYDKNIEILKNNTEPSYIQFSRGFGKRYALAHSESLYFNLGRHRYIQRNIFNKHVPSEMLHYLEPLPRQYCIWIQHSDKKYSDIFDKRRESFRKNFNNKIRYYSEQFKVEPPAYLNNSSDDFYDIYNHRKVYDALQCINDFKFEEYKQLYNLMNSNKKLIKIINDFSMSSPDTFVSSSLSNLKAGEYVDYFDNYHNKYIRYYALNSAPRSVSRDYSFFAYSLIKSKDRYKKYLNENVFNKDKYNDAVCDILNKLDDFIQKRFNVSDDDISTYTRFYQDCLNNYNSCYISKTDDYYVEYKDKILKLVYKKDVQYYFDFNNIDSLDTDNFNYHSDDIYSEIFTDDVIDFSK